MNVFELDIVTPEEKIFSGRVISVTVPGVLGKFQVLCHHAPIISTLGEGQLDAVEENGNKLDYYVRGGVIEVMFNKATILVEEVIKQKGKEEVVS